MGNKTVASNIAWNTAGNIFYLGCQWLLSVVVVRISGSYAEAGILTLAISVTNIFAVLATFGVRNYQVSDVTEKYAQSDYISHRVLTCSAAMGLCAVFVVINGYPASTSLSIIAYMLMKTVEAASDVFHGILQKQWRLDIVGKSYIYRGVILLISFTAMYKYTDSLLLSLLIMAVLTLMVFLLYDYRIVKRLSDVSCTFRIEKIFQLSKECLPALGYAICINSIVSVARFFIEQHHGEETLGYYGSVSTIAVVVQIASSLILSPLNGVISDYYARGERHKILEMLGKTAVLLFALTGIAVAGAAVLGKFVLALLFGRSIEPYAYLLIPTIITSGLTGLVWFLGMLLTIMREMKMLLFGAAIGVAVSVGLSALLIPSLVFDGANIAIIAAFSAVAVLYTVVTAAVLRKKGSNRRLP